MEYCYYPTWTDAATDLYLNQFSVEVWSMGWNNCQACPLACISLYRHRQMEAQTWQHLFPCEENSPNVKWSLHSLQYNPIVKACK